jgi:hypothetical protein
VDRAPTQRVREGRPAQCRGASYVVADIVVVTGDFRCGACLWTRNPEAERRGEHNDREPAAAVQQPRFAKNGKCTLGALIWFLVRVIPKPSGASYPCQRSLPPDHWLGTLDGGLGLKDLRTRSKCGATVVGEGRFYLEQAPP